LAAVAIYEGDPGLTLEWAVAAREHDTGSISGYTDRWRRLMLGSALHDTGDVVAAGTVLRELVALCQRAGDRFMEANALLVLAEGCLETGQTAEGREFANGSLTIFAELNDRLMLTDAFRVAAHYGVADRPTDAARLIGAREACLGDLGTGPNAHDDAHVETVTQLIARACGAEEIAEARNSGLTMSTDQAVALAHDLLADVPTDSASDPASVLSKRERELLSLLAEGLTDVEIGQKLFISVRTVRSHLDRIRDKTGCRRRAELTKLVLSLP
jgi:DNA-binding CsgD family transcriptional regulator